jgi:signal peptidase II
VSTGVDIARRRGLGLVLAGVVAALDQLIKGLMLGRADLRAPVELLPIFRLSFTENYGVSLGLLTADTQEMRWLLVALTGVIAAGVLVWMFRERRLPDIVALSLVLGGAIGNIVDRVLRGFVVDYADLHFGDWRPFLIFNLADAAISCGVVIILARSLFWSDKRDPAAKTAPET